jgi:hypothetical protein
MRHQGIEERRDVAVSMLGTIPERKGWRTRARRLLIIIKNKRGQLFMYTLCVWNPENRRTNKGAVLGRGRESAWLHRAVAADGRRRDGPVCSTERRHDLLESLGP